MIVRFATRCDGCQRRSAAYTSWPSCRECGADTCQTCAQPGTLQEDEGTATVLCRTCAAIDTESERAS